MEVVELTRADQFALCIVKWAAEERRHREEDVPRSPWPRLPRDQARRLHGLGYVTWDGAPELVADEVCCVPRWNWWR